LTVNLDNLIAKAQSGPGCRRILKRCADESIDLITMAQVSNRGANSKVLRALFGSEGGVLTGSK
jgi:hypothetical protein